MHPQSMFLKNITIFHLKIVIFTTVKNCSILNRRVCVMTVLMLNEFSSFDTEELLSGGIA